jgi:hypothetical protein
VARRRVPRLSIAFRRAIQALGIVTGSPRSRAVMATVGALSAAETLPGPSDVRSRFAPGYAHVRRVTGENLWIWYRFDDVHLDALTVKNEPPVPDDDDDTPPGKRPPQGG